jgi:hypothetical protein
MHPAKSAAAVSSCFYRINIKSKYENAVAIVKKDKFEPIGPDDIKKGRAYLVRI